MMLTITHLKTFKNIFPLDGLRRNIDLPDRNIKNATSIAPAEAPKASG